jgi:hypothetical protein
VGLVCFLTLEMGLGLQVYRGDPSFFGEGGRHAARAGMCFAIADFDGDRQPDLATIEVASQRWIKSNYSIHLQLSRGAESAFGVSAPSGGVRISARDVNGDDILDLIVTSLSDEHVVAVLLNDGHGQFSSAEPSAYAALAKESDLFLKGQEELPADKLTVASLRHSFEGEGAKSSTTPEALSAHSVTLPETSPLLSTQLRVCWGRSPPPVVFSS